MGARILVADDSVTIQKVVELTFSKEDFVLDQARSGDEAIRKAKEARPDLVLLDLVMPDMNGYDVCAALRSDPALRAMPVILLAGTFESFDHQRAAQVGANDFVTKPFESQALVGKVKQLLFAKVMGSKSVGPAAGLAAGAVTVTISPSAVAARVAAPKPPEAPPSVRPSAPTTPPAPEPEELWTLLGEPPAATPVVAQPAEGVETSTSAASVPGGGSAGPPEDALDLGTPDLEPLSGEIVPAEEATDNLPFPESLSLDELLATSATTPTATWPAEPSQAEATSAAPVFDLSDAEAPLLPMAEAGTGEPPALAVDELLLPPGDETAPEDTLTMELPEFDLTPPPVADSSAAADLVAAPPAVLREEAAAGEISLQDVGTEASEVAETELAAAGPQFEFFSSPQMVEPTAVPDQRAAEAAAETPDIGATEQLAGSAAATLTAPAAGQPTPVVPAAVSETDMAALREAVTERVARDLKRDLSEKLLDRFEKIVWEVVPDLAEILITKEIERIRRLAEEEKPS